MCHDMNRLGVGSAMYQFRAWRVRAGAGLIAVLAVGGYQVVAAAAASAAPAVATTTTGIGVAVGGVHSG